MGRTNAVGATVKKGSLLLAGGLSAKGVTVTAESLTYATIATDQSDYNPGMTVTVTGTGWQPGETVQIVIHEDPMLEADVTLTAIADSAGNTVNTQFQPGCWHDFVCDGKGSTVRAYGSDDFHGFEHRILTHPPVSRRHRRGRSLTR